MTRNSHGKALEGGEFEGRETKCPAPLRFLSQERKLGKESELSRPLSFARKKACKESGLSRRSAVAA